MVYQDIPVAMGVFWGFSPQTKLQATPNWIMKPYKLVEF